jgi:hypothetical protein
VRRSLRSSLLSPDHREASVPFHFDARGKLFTSLLNCPPEPGRVDGRRVVEPEMPDLQRRQIQSDERAGSRIDAREIHKRQIAAEFLTPGSQQYRIQQPLTGNAGLITENCRF